MTNSNRLPVFRTLKETTHDQFKKRYKLLLLWACFQWGALILQSLTELIPAIKQNQYVEAEAIILALIVLTWVLFIVLIRKSFQSYNWFRFFDYTSIIGTLVVSACSLWRTAVRVSTEDTHQETIENSRHFVEISFSVCCFLFLTQNKKIRSACFVVYFLYNLAFTIMFETPIDILTGVLFFVLTCTAFGILSTVIHESHENMLEEQKDFWKHSFEMIPHGIAIFDRTSALAYHNTSLREILKEENGGSGNPVTLDTLDFAERVMQLPVTQRRRLPTNDEHSSESILTLRQTDFSSFITQHVKSMQPLVPLFAECTVGNKKIEIKAQKSTLKGYGDYFTVVFVDVTYRDRLAQLEDQNGFKDLLFKSVAHELRGPLNGSMMSILPLLDTDLPKKYKESIKISLICQERLLKSIDGILELAKLNSKKFSIILQEFDLKEALDNLMRLFEDAIQKKKLKVFIELFEKLDPAAPTTITSDQERVEFILYHIIDNAIKFTAPHGSVTIRAEMLSSQTDSSIRFIVTDTGCGMTKEEIAKIHELSITSFTKTKINDNSTGACLGLTMVKALLQHLGSEFEVRSAIGKGSEFTFLLKNFKKANSTDHYYEPTRRTEGGLDSESQSPCRLLKMPEVKLDETSQFSFRQELEADEIIDVGNKFSEICESASRAVLKTKHLTTVGVEDFPRFLSLRSSAFPKIRSSFKGPQILIVDDDAFNIFALQTTLVQMGYEVLVAYNGKEAVDLIKIDHSAVMLIFMDLNMPVMNGYAATKELKRLMTAGMISAIPIIACTAYSQEKERELCLQSGFDDFLTKPLNGRKLAQLIKKFLEEK